MTSDGTHGSQHALIGQWPASAGQSCAWQLRCHRGPQLAGCCWPIRSGGAVMGGAIRHARTRNLAARTSTALLKSP